MGKPLKNPPVYFTIAQARFNPILKLADFLSTIQDKFRTALYPDFRTLKISVLQLNVRDGQTAASPISVDRYVFQNLTKTHSFLLETDKLTFQSTDYGQFETFSKEFLDGLELLHGVVDLAFVDRVGLRYLDRVAPRESESLREYLRSGVLGLSDSLGGRTLHSYSETACDVGNVKVISRVAIQEGAVGFPPDLQPQDMAVTTRFNNYDGQHAVLDNDGFFEGREPFGKDTVRAHLNSIHAIISTAFKATVTPQALERWDA